MTAERLKPILAAVAERARGRRARASLADLRAELQIETGRREAFVNALASPELAFIAECKRRAPSAGELSDESNLQDRIRTYQLGGAAALSILTEQDHFGGSLADLSAAPEVALPRLRKDFLLDEAMVLEAQLAGASAVLLIVAALDPVLLAELRATAQEVGLGVLIEVHDERELELASPLGPEALGVNARDLTTFEIDLQVSERVLPLMPAGTVRVAESGLHTLDDLRRMRSAGADAVLVGTALMRSTDPAQTLAGWRTELNG
jgi:indole-3-glycerol phosphate synthase